MGSFLGHVLPGLALIAWGVYWALIAFNSLRNRDRKRKMEPKRDHWSLPPFEPTTRILVVIVHAATELYWHARGHNIQHVAIVAGFGVPALLDLLIFYGVGRKCLCSKALT